jgi:hypothetical protein
MIRAKVNDKVTVTPPFKPAGAEPQKKLRQLTF